MNKDQVMADSRMLALDLTQQALRISRGLPKDEVNIFFGMTCARVFQNSVILMALSLHDKGDNGGREFIEEMYKHAMADALKRWNKRDMENL